jgi:hypothetical protein
VAGWAGYLAVVGGLFLRAPRIPGAKSRPEHETSARPSAHIETDASR